MREAERREQAALDYAKGVEESRKKLEKKFKKTDSDYIKKFETSIQTGLEGCTKRISCAIDLEIQRLKLRLIKELQR